MTTYSSKAIKAANLSLIGLVGEQSRYKLLISNEEIKTTNEAACKLLSNFTNVSECIEKLTYRAKKVESKILSLYNQGQNDLAGNMCSELFIIISAFIIAENQFNITNKNFDVQDLTDIADDIEV